MKKILTIFVILLSTLVFAQSVNPSLDGRAIVADSGIFPPGGYYGKAPGYLPGDTVVVTNHSTGFTLNVMILSSYDASEGIAIMLSPEAAEKLQIIKGRDVYVKVQKKQSIMYENTLETAKNKSVQKNIQELDPDKNPLVLPGNTEEKIREASIKEVVVEETQPEVAEIEEVTPVEEVVVEEIQPELAEIDDTITPIEDDEQIVLEEEIPQEETTTEIVDTVDDVKEVEIAEQPEQPEENVTEVPLEPVVEEAILDDYQETEVADEEIIEPVIEVAETPVVETPIENFDTEVVQDEPEVAVLTEDVEVTQEPVLEETTPVYPEEVAELDDQVTEDFSNEEEIEVTVEETVEPVIEEEVKDLVELADSEGEEVYEDVIPSDIAEAEVIEEKEELADIDDMYENGIDEQIVFDSLGSDESEFVRTSFGESESLVEEDTEIVEDVQPQEELAEIDDTVIPEESDEEILVAEEIIPEEVDEVATIEEQPVDAIEEPILEEAKIEEVEETSIEDAKDIFSQITGEEVVLEPAEETEIEIPTEIEIVVEQPAQEIIPLLPEEKDEIVIELDKKEDEVVISNNSSTNFSEKYSKNFVSDMKSLKKTKQAKSKTYYIQIATMSNESNVANVIEKYGKTYSIYLIQQKNKSYQVLIGPLNDDEYELVLARFKRTYKDAFLRVIK